MTENICISQMIKYILASLLKLVNGLMHIVFRSELFVENGACACVCVCVCEYVCVCIVEIYMRCRDLFWFGIWSGQAGIGVYQPQKMFINCQLSEMLFMLWVRNHVIFVYDVYVVVSVTERGTLHQLG